MKNQNEEIDEMIKKALSKEEAAYYDNLNEESLTEMIVGLYKGKLMWYNVLMVILSLVLFGLGVYCLIQFIEVENTNEVIRWGAAMSGCFLTMSMLKLWNWNQIDKNAMMREIKRLELLIASK